MPSTPADFSVIPGRGPAGRFSRRTFLAGLGASAIARVAGADTDYAQVTPHPLEFPRDFGAHAGFRNEWWYLTGWLDATPEPLGFQVTFFRVRTDVDPANPSAFTATQLLIAHAALADPARGKLVHDERLARAGFGIAGAAGRDTDVNVGDWRLDRDPVTDTYHGRIAARDFTLDFEAHAPGPPLVQGEGGYSRKGPLHAQASHYYSRPRLAVHARLASNSGTADVAGTAWLDHEWSSTVLAPEAVGWDWTGMNLDSGGSLTAFQIRRRDQRDGAALWAYAAIVDPDGTARVFNPGEVSFRPLRHWTSPRTGAAWPVVQAIDVGGRSLQTAPLMDDQELDARFTTGAVYWEGASTLWENGQRVGRGYLELTGYLEPLRL